mmetsp:Transcript_8982/g.14986  ORF Transcript_8982/g.14986 Transcript_8982/m.14986 type:complete len:111 (+) Transcript_8982:381-713(+)
MEPNQPKALLPSITSLGNLGTIDIAALTKVIFELAPSSFPGEVTHKQLATLLCGGAGHEPRALLLVVRSAAHVVMATMATTMVASTAVVAVALLAILADEDGPAIELGVL